MNPYNYPIRQKSAQGKPSPKTSIERRCQACGASFIGLAPGKTGEAGLWDDGSRWWCSVECAPASVTSELLAKLDSVLAEASDLGAQLAEWQRNAMRYAEQRDGAYRERAALVAFLAACYPSQMAHDENDDDEEGGWRLVTIETPAGQMAWHLHPDDGELFPHVPEGRPEWDGHTTEAKYERLAALTADVAKSRR